MPYFDQHAKYRSQEMFDLAGEYKANLKARPCKKCGRAIGFLPSSDGKTMPVDVVPIKVYLPDGHGYADVRYAYSSHFDTCIKKEVKKEEWESF